MQIERYIKSLAT